MENKRKNVRKGYKYSKAMKRDKKILNKREDKSNE